jgi:hypothetical protein
MNTILLDTVTNDLVVDANGNIALASAPYAQAQDAASAIKTFQGECYYDTTLGVPYWSQVLGKNPPLALVKSLLVAAAETVPDPTSTNPANTVSAQCFISAFANRQLSGQVQVTTASGQASAASFALGAPAGPVNPGAGEFKLDYSVLGGEDVLG